MASTGFAGGLADGINNGMQMGMQYQYYKGRNDHYERQDELRQQQLDAKGSSNAAGLSGGGSGKGKADREGFMNSLIPIFQAGKTAPAQAAMPSAAPVNLGNSASPAGLGGSSPTSLQNDAYQAGGLGSAPQPMQPAQSAAPEEPVNPMHEIVKQMAVGNLSNEPDKLNAIHAAAVMHGMGDDVGKWLEGLYKSKKSGLFDAAMDLKRGNVDGAMASMKQGGINLEDRPVKVKPDDPKDSQWKVNISGTGEQVINLDEWAASTMDPEKYAKSLNDKQDSETKSRVADSQINENNAGAQKNLSMAKSYASGGLGSGRRTGGGGAAGPKVQRTVETNQGMVAVMTDGSQRPLKGADGKPLFGTSGQKVAAGLIGKTLDPLSDGGDIAARVNTMTGQLQGDSPPPPAKIKDIPEGAKLIGTAKGKPVYQLGNKKWVGD